MDSSVLRNHPGDFNLKVAGLALGFNTSAVADGYFKGPWSEIRMYLHNKSPW